MSQELKITVRQGLALFAIFSCALLAVHSTAAWTPPSQAPTGGNASPFLHTGPDNQVKEGSLGVQTLAVDQLCLGAACKAAWPTPDCRVCVRAGTANGGLSSEACAPFDNTVAFAGAEDSSHGRGTVVQIRVLCP